MFLLIIKFVSFFTTIVTKMVPVYIYVGFLARVLHMTYTTLKYEFKL